MGTHFDINENGCSIRCKLYCADSHDVRRVIVFCHGFGGHKDNRAAETFAQRAVTKRRGTAVVVFDWPCHGSDARKNLLLEDCDTYLTTVVAYCRRQFGTDELYAYGTSFGGYLLLKYLLEHGNPFRKVALRCPAIDMRQTLVDTILTDIDLHKLQSGKTILAGFDRKVKIGPAFLEGLGATDLCEHEFFDYADDLLVVHGTADEVVPCAASESFCDDNAIEFVPIEGADHRFRDPRRMDAAIARIIEFFEL